MPEEGDDMDKTAFAPSDDRSTEKYFSHSAEKQKTTSDSDSSYDMLMQKNEVSSIEEEEEEDSLELFGHEKRALNYLVNEYLLQYGYKLTAITFSDENTDEDFEDWESIGLNISKPPDLGRIYRNFNSRKSRNATQKKDPITHKYQQQCETNDSETQCDVTSESENTISELSELVLNNEFEIERLKLELKSEIDRNSHLNEKNEQYGQFEILEKELRSKIRDLEKEKEHLLLSQKSGRKANVLDDPRINTDQPMDKSESENLPPNHEANIQTEIINPDKIEDTTPFFKFLRHKCIPCFDDQNNLDENPVSSVDTFDGIIKLLATQLPQIVPHVLLSRRGTILPLLLIAVEHHKSPDIRDNLLTILFNLTKKPDAEMRSIIVKGFIEIVSRQKTSENNNAMIEEEILPQLWQQIEHKHCERRILVAETCAWLLPHIPADIRDSLIFSMLQQLVLQDRENQVNLP